MRSSRGALVSLLLVPGVVAAACGGDDPAPLGPTPPGVGGSGGATSTASTGGEGGSGGEVMPGPRPGVEWSSSRPRGGWRRRVPCWSASSTVPATGPGGGRGWRG